MPSVQLSCNRAVSSRQGKQGNDRGTAPHCTVCPTAPQIGTGFRLEVATVRKLEFETDAFAFADKALGSWYKVRAAPLRSWWYYAGAAARCFLLLVH